MFWLFNVTHQVLASIDISKYISSNIITFPFTATQLSISALSNGPFPPGTSWILETGAYAGLALYSWRGGLPD
jgi:hypothetical protein